MESACEMAVEYQKNNYQTTTFKSTVHKPANQVFIDKVDICYCLNWKLKTKAYQKLK